jgi:hypothetical protein
MFGILWLPLTMNPVNSKNLLAFDKAQQIQNDSTNLTFRFYEEEDIEEKRLSISSFNILFQMLYQFSVRDFLKN